MMPQLVLALREMCSVLRRRYYWHEDLDEVTSDLFLKFLTLQHNIKLDKKSTLNYLWMMANNCYKARKRYRKWEVLFSDCSHEELSGKLL